MFHGELVTKGGVEPMVRNKRYWSGEPMNTQEADHNERGLAQQGGMTKPDR